jgi:hypothetical protein
MRFIIISAIAISVVVAGPQAAGAKQVYSLQQYPEDFAKVPCSAFKNSPNGAWKEVAVFVFRGQRFTGNTYSAGSREAGIINQKCGAK